MPRRSWICLTLVCLAIAVGFSAMAHEGHEHDVRLTNLATGNPAGTYDSQVQITEHGDHRFITSNGLPEHATGQFPGPRNPNQIREQNHRFRVPMNPVAAAKPTPVKLGKFGIALNGIPFDPGAAEFWRRDFSSPWQYAVIGGKVDLGLDQNQAHVQPTGDYHYHGRPIDLVVRLSREARKGNKSMTLLGYAADGYPIYDCEVMSADGTTRSLRSSYRLRTGQRQGGNDGPGGSYDGTFVADYEYIAKAGDLDEFNGQTGITPEYPDGTFYYVLTETFPYIPRLLKGTPDPSFVQRGPGRGGPPGGRGRGPGGRRPPPFGPLFGPPR